MADVLGIDIGRYSIKIAGIRTTIRGARLNLLKEFVFPQGSSLFSDSNVDALKTFFAIEELTSSNIIVSLPSDLVAVHTISVPFTENKFISKAVATELEGVTTISLEESVMDYNIIQKAQDHSLLITFSISNDAMKTWLDALSLLDIDPNIVCVSHCAYSNIAAFLKLDDPFIILDIGHSHTSLSFMNKDGLFLARDLKIGAQALGLTSERNAINEQAATLLVNQIKFAIDVAEKRYNTQIRAVIFAGRFYETGKLLEKQLEIETFSLPINDIAKAALTDSPPLEPQYSLALALALSNVIKKPRNLINLRKGQFQFKRAIEQIRGRLFTTVGILAVLVIMFIVNISYGYISLNQKKNILENKMHELFKRAYPNEPSLGDPFGTMKYLVSKEKKRVENLSSSIPTVEMLRELSTAIPKDVTVDVTELSIDPEQITLIGKTPTIDAIDKIVAGIKTLDTIKDVKVIDTSRSADQKSFKFQLSITLK